MRAVDSLATAVHDALNKTAVSRTPDAGTLPTPVNGPSRALPPPRPLTGTLEETLLRRRSGYAFGQRQPELAEVASLLILGVGTAPRAGGMVSVIPYLVVRGAGALAPGVHRADLRLPVRGLAAVRAGDPTDYLAASIDQTQFAGRAPLWVALAIDLRTTLERYPPRHYRTVHLDAGVALQNILLVATSLGLAACPVMGYDDRAWERLLDLPAGTVVAGVVPVGPRTPET